MYLGAWVEGFEGAEGPRDPKLGAVCARLQNRVVKAMLVNFSTRPNTLEGECFYSADIPGEVRRVLRRFLAPICGGLSHWRRW